MSRPLKVKVITVGNSGKLIYIYIYSINLGFLSDILIRSKRVMGYI